MRLAYTIAHSIGGVWGADPGGDQDLPVVRVADFDYGALRVNRRIPTARSISISERATRLLEPGDILLEKSGGGLTTNVGRAVLYSSQEPAVCSNFIQLLRPAPGYDPRFLVYLHRVLYVRGVAAACTKQNTGIQNLGVGDYLATAVDVPAIERQRATADVLDRECDRIATLDRSLRAIVDTTDEAAIAHTRDLVGFGRYDPVQIRYVARPGTGHTPSRSHPEWWIPEECTFPWFTLADVHQLRNGDLDYVSDTSERISEVGLANSSAVRHPASTVLLSRTASVGFAAIMATEMAVSQDFMTWTCGPRLEPTFLLHALRASRTELLGLMHGSTHKTIYMPELLALRVPLPTVSVQRDVVTKVDRLSASRRGLTMNTAAMRTKLAEYRDALITEAVTGQLDVTAVSDTQMDERLHQAVETATA